MYNWNDINACVFSREVLLKFVPMFYPELSFLSFSLIYVLRPLVAFGS
jgi:hypothetical protein